MKLSNSKCDFTDWGGGGASGRMERWQVTGRKRKRFPSPPRRCRHLTLVGKQSSVITFSFCSKSLSGACRFLYQKVRAMPASCLCAHQVLWALSYSWPSARSSCKPPDHLTPLEYFYSALGSELHICCKAPLVLWLLLSHSLLAP